MVDKGGGVSQGLPAETPSATGGEEPTLASILQEVKTLSSKFDNLGGQFSVLQTTVNDWKTSVNIEVAQIKTQTQTCEDNIALYKDTFETATAAIIADATFKDTFETRVTDLEEKLSELTTEDVIEMLRKTEENAKKMAEKQDYLENVRERELRKKNIRLNGVAEQNNEKCMELTKATLAKLTKLKLDNIQGAYRLGKKADEDNMLPRTILIKFRDVWVRNSIYRDCRKNKQNLRDVFLQDHLTKPDIDQKKRAKSQMEEAQQQGKRHEFVDGKLRIEGKFVKIKETTEGEDEEEGD